MSSTLSAHTDAALLALVALHTDHAVVITDADGVIEWVNDAFCELTGYSADEAIGVTRGSLFTHTVSGTVSAALGGEPSDQPHNMELLTRSKQGRPYWTAIEVRPVLVDGAVSRLILLESDVSATQVAEHQLLEASRRAELLAAELSTEKSLLSGVISSIPHLVYWKDLFGRYRGVNAAFLAERGFAEADDVVGRTEWDLASDNAFSRELRAVETAARDGEPVIDHHITMLDADGKTRSLLLSVLPQRDVHGVPDGLIGVGADVTHIAELERTVAQTNRLESIGQLAAGIAHEINTPVQFVSDNARFLGDAFGELLPALQRVTATLSAEPAAADQSPADAVRLLTELRAALAGVELTFLAAEIPNAIAESQEGLGRITQIVRAMKDFSHPGSGLMETDINRAVESTVQVSRNEWKYVAELNLDLDPEVGLVPCFEGELKQVILNIIVNASHSIAARREAAGATELGTITLRTERCDDLVKITIRDNGTGMDEETRRKIFDPFFTTKEVGKGTGQGLSMAHNTIVTKHGGQIDVLSAPGRGATFVLMLPAHGGADSPTEEESMLV